MTILDVLLYIVPSFIALITAVARLNDIKRSQSSKRWWVRRLGLLFLTGAMAMMIMSYFSIATAYWTQIMRFLLLWGLALSWVTTPNQEPWWKYISKYDPLERRHGD